MPENVKSSIKANRLTSVKAIILPIKTSPSVLRGKENCCNGAAKFNFGCSVTISTKMR